MIGKTISHYKILDKLGEGGMGVVYKAEDTDLKRTVALKFLSPQALAGDEEKARFVHEAQAAAALNHPNICTVYEIGKSEGDSFIAMECIEGQSLKDTICAGALEIDMAIDITVQIGSALQKAHEKDIVHRDIKPGNVMVTPDGQVKIMDFGLAKSSEQTRLTKTGSTVGTVAYMSPEQTRGDEVDHRTDVWSLGVILYEMVTGKVPFGGEFEQAVLYSILNEEPKPISNFTSSAPVGLQRIIDKALEKNVGDRYQSADELVADLEELKDKTRDLALQSGRLQGSSVRRKVLLGGLGVVAVLTAVILLSPYFARPGIISRLKGEGTQGELAGPEAALQEEAFVVVVAPFWGQSDDAIAEGEVMRALIERRLKDELGHEKNVRILGQDLTDAPRAHEEARALGKELDAAVVLWGEILTLRDEVEIQPYMTLVGLDLRQLRERAASALQANLQDPNQLAMRKAKAEEVGNMALVVAAIYYEDDDPDKALSVLRRISPPTSESLRWQGNVYLYQDNYEEATRLYNEALELDPSDAWAQAGIGNVYRSRGDLETAIEQYVIACELGPGLPYPRHQLGIAYHEQGEYETAITEYEKCIELDPDYDVAYNSLAVAYVRLGKFAEAIPHYKKAIELDPTYGNAHLGLAWVYAWQGEYESAVEHAKRAMEDHPDWIPASVGAGTVLSLSGKHEEAVAAFRKALELDPDRAVTHRRLGEAYLQIDEADSALSAFQNAVELAPEDALCHWYQCIAHTWKGQHDEAAAAIETAVQLDPTEPYSNLFYFVSLHRAGREAEAHAHIEKFSKAQTDTAWAVPVVRFYAGQMTAEDVLKRTDDPDERKAKGQLCEAFYYIGMAHLLALVPECSPADTVKAVEYLEKCVATDMAAYTEHGCAERELERLKR